MREQLENILKHSGAEVIASPDLTMSLFKVYSALFLAGKAPNFCSKCAYDYYNELKQRGYERLKFIEMKTCKLVENKIFNVRVNNAIITYTDANMSDEIAIKLLNEKKLEESDFIKLPVKLVEFVEELNEISEPKSERKKRTPKNK